MKKRTLAVFALSSLMMTSCGLTINKKQVSEEVFNKLLQKVDKNHNYTEATMKAYYYNYTTDARAVEEEATLHYIFHKSYFFTNDKGTEMTSVFVDAINNVNLANYDASSSFEMAPVSVPENAKLSTKYYADSSGFGCLASASMSETSNQISADAKVELAVEFNIHGLLSRFELKGFVSFKIYDEPGTIDIHYGCNIDYK